ncbi:MAG: hypothetical protein ACKVLC_06275 [Phycisphaerales bacterium]
MSTNSQTESQPKIYDGDGDILMEADRQAVTPEKPQKNATKSAFNGDTSCFQT